MEEKVRGYVARDEDGGLFLYIGDRPYIICGNSWISPNHYACMLGKNLFPHVKFSDLAAREVEITIKEI